MDYRVEIGDREVSLVTTKPDDKGALDISIDEALSQRWILRSDRPHLVKMTHQGRQHSGWVVRAPDGTWIWSEGRAHLVRDTAERRIIRGPAGGGPAAIVTPPTPAIVVQLLVQLGDTVERGQALVVISAMKMETTLVAPHAGTVVAINTKDGAKVNPGDILVNIEPAPEAEGESDNV